MRNSSAPLVIFLVLMITVLCGGFVYFYMQFLPEPKKAIKCTNEWSTISFMINEETGSVVMSGETLDPQNIQIMNETAVSAEWTHKNSGQTKIFLDRIAGELEVKTRPDPGSEWEESKFKCNQSKVRF